MKRNLEKLCDWLRLRKFCHHQSTTIGLILNGSNKRLGQNEANIMKTNLQPNLTLTLTVALN